MLDTADTAPDVTVVVPVYNTARFLSACLDSIDGQSGASFEVILVDDGSTDDSSSICDSYCEKREKAFVIHKDNEGLLAARRDGLRRAKGRYILALDSDDRLLEGCLEKVCAAIETTGADIISFDFTMQLDPIEPALKAGIAPGMHAGSDFGAIRDALAGCDFNSVWNKAVRADLIPKQDWFTERVGLMHGEDLCQLLPVFDRAHSLYHIDEPLYYYRQHGSNSTRRFREKQIEDWGFVSDELLAYASRWSGESLRRARRGVCKHYCDLEEALWRCDIDVDARSLFDKRIKNEYHRRIRGCPDVLHGLVLSNSSLVSFVARHVLDVLKRARHGLTRGRRPR